MTDTLMTFNEAIAAIPFNPNQSTATGLVAAIMRATGHILYLVGALAEGTENYELTDEEARRELQHAEGHLIRTSAVAESAPISATAKTYINAFVTAVVYANAEWESWDADTRGPNLRALADRAAALGAYLDLELAGIGASDPGRTL